MGKYSILKKNLNKINFIIFIENKKLTYTRIKLKKTTKMLLIEHFGEFH